MCVLIVSNSFVTNEDFGKFYSCPNPRAKKEATGSLACCLNVLPNGAAPISKTFPGKNQDDTEQNLYN